MNIKKECSKFREILKQPGIIRIITHLDTDGLSSASIFIQALKKLDQQFVVSTVRQLEEELLEDLYDKVQRQKTKCLVFLDLGSNSLEKIIAFANHTDILVLDHHEIQNKDFFKEHIETNEKILFINPILDSDKEEDKISASSVTYLFVKELDEKNKEFAQIAVLGMIGDMLDKNISKKNGLILEDAKLQGLKIKRGPTIFASTRPLHKSLEYSNIFIPGVTGHQNGALGLLKDLDIAIRSMDGNYRTVLDLTKEEMSRLLTAIILRRMDVGKNQDIIDNIYLMKFKGQLWDARELSTMINACGRLGHSSLGIAFLMGSKNAKDSLELIYNKYRHQLIKALNWVNNNDKIENSKCVIINAKKEVKDTIIGTVISILASSYVYEEGKILIGMAYRKDKKIKISARISGSRENNIKINLAELLNKVLEGFGGEVGGHNHAAGCLIKQNDEIKFLEMLQKNLEIDEIKI